MLGVEIIQSLYAAGRRETYPLGAHRQQRRRDIESSQSGLEIGPVLFAAHEECADGEGGGSPQLRRNRASSLKPCLVESHVAPSLLILDVPAALSLACHNEVRRTSVHQSIDTDISQTSAHRNLKLMATEALLA